MRRTIIFLSVLFTATYSQIWTNNGPFGARITSIAADPLDTTILYAGTFGGGIYKSKDSGYNWYSINDGLPEWENKNIGSPTLPSWWFGNYYPISTISIREDSSQYLYAGTNGGGVAFSTDNGLSWAPINDGLPDNPDISSIWISPGNASFLLCGLKGDGLYKSINSGKSWEFVSHIQDSNGFVYDVKDIQSNPLNPDSIFVSVGNALFLSSDNGLTWESLNQHLGFDRILVLRSNPNHLLAIADTQFEDNMLMNSTDGGQKWDFFPQGETWGNISALDLDADGNIYVYKQDENKLYISADEGKFWDSQPLISNYGEFSGETFSITPFMVSPNNPQHIYFGTQAGFFHSFNNGQDYVLQEQGMVNTYINALAVNPKEPDIAYAGGDNGLWKTSDGGSSWQRLSLINISSIVIDKDRPDTLYAGGDGLLRSYNGGISFNFIVKDEIVTNIEIQPNSSSTLFAGLYPSLVTKSINYGLNWNTSFSPSHGSFRIKDIRFHQTNDSTIYFGTDNNQLNHGLYKSTNLGESWDKISDPGLIKSIELTNPNEDTVFVCTDKKVLISEDGGYHFSVSYDSISNNMSSIYKHPFYNTLLVSTKDNGCFQLDLGSGEVNPIFGKYDPRVSAIDWHSGKDFYFATHGSAVWLGKDIITSLKDFKQKSIPYKHGMVMNYPNPFNSTTQILFYVQHPSSYWIKIYGTSGQLVKEYSPQNYSNGYHKIEWNGKNNEEIPVSSGLYIISISNDTSSRFHKIVLLK